MGRPKLEDTRNKSIRLPDRLWSLIEEASRDTGIKVNNIIWRLIEDFLVRHGYLKNEDRKREPLD